MELQRVLRVLCGFAKMAHITIAEYQVQSVMLMTMSVRHGFLINATCLLGLSQIMPLSVSLTFCICANFSVLLSNYHIATENLQTTLEP